VAAGLDRVAAGAETQLAGRRVALVAHAASVTADGRHALDVLRDSGTRVMLLLAPEHGLRGTAAAGEEVPDAIEAGVPVISLYGPRTRPGRAALADVDALVFDLQDAGVRFYTYLATLAECLAAAAEAGVEVVVLDRPNPLGGEYVAGPAAAPGDAPSLLDRLPGTLIHGLTAAEMGALLAARMPRPPPLRAVEMAGWRRAMRWPDTGRSWTPPSPNLRSAQAALAYPGVALLEATNVSEGRGSWAPFLRIGAPWLDPDAVRARVAATGYDLYPVRFRPRAGPAAPSPKHEGELLPGVGVAVTDPAAADPWALGLELLACLRRFRGFRWRSPGALDRLVGSPRLREALEAGRSPEQIRGAEAAEVDGFRRDRLRFLRYS
jgi:uncharacterized protein YbbC (DUF1343 family)